MEPLLIQIADLPGGDRSLRFEGHTDDVGVSFFVTDAAAGHGPSLHTHPYAEVFVVEEGRVAFASASRVTSTSTGVARCIRSGSRNEATRWCLTTRGR